MQNNTGSSSLLPQPTVLGSPAEDPSVVNSDVGPRYSIKQCVGAGSHGVVFSAIDQESPPSLPSSVAIKRISRSGLRYEALVRVLREVLLMKHLRHPSVIGLRDLFIVNGSVYLVTELMESDLERVSTTGQQFTERHVKYFLFQLLSALQHLHAAGVIHRDVKPSNILVNANCKLKLCDLGLSRELTSAGGVPDPAFGGSPVANAGSPTGVVEGSSRGERKDQMLTEYVCTRWYRAPELLLQSKSYGASIDVWSAGCVGVELLIKEPLFPGRNTIDQLEKIIDALGPVTPDPSIPAETHEFLLAYRRKPGAVPLTHNLQHVSPELQDLLLRMLAFSPAARVSVTDALAHATLAEFSQRVTPTPFVDRFYFGKLPEKSDEVFALLEKSARRNTATVTTPSAVTGTKSVLSPPTS